MARFLIIRFSALGDVAMTIPVIDSLAHQYPHLGITVLSKAIYSPLFERLPENVTFVGADFKKKHIGWQGLNRLLADTRYKECDFVADFHGVLRTFYLDTVCRFAGCKVAVINKGRNEKNKLVHRHKRLQPLKSSFLRYSDVLAQLGFPVTLDFVSLFPSKIKTDLIKRIGIAPFAKHTGKIYPLHLMEQVIDILSKKENVEVYLFGSGEAEKAIIDEWCDKYPHLASVVGKYNFSGELELMNRLDVMLTMDSANMHLASLVATPVVSIWGATHPFAGFMGWNQTDAVQLDLSCRPCSVYGNKPCRRGDYACLKDITPAMIVGKIEANLK